MLYYFVTDFPEMQVFINVFFFFFIYLSFFYLIQRHLSIQSLQTSCHDMVNLKLGQRNLPKIEGNFDTIIY